MRIIKITGLTTLTLLLLSSVIGYFYFDKKFTPPENQLSVSNDEVKLPIKWVANQDSEIAALLLPFKLAGIPDTFYLQFDLGAQSTIFYKKSLQSIYERYSALKPQHPAEEKLVNFSLGDISVSANNIRRVNYGSKINWNASAINVIGTLGTDILEHKVVIMDFKKHFIHFRNHFPKEVAVESIQDFQFKKRKVLLYAQVNSENKLLYYDSGSSAFELITSKKQWEKLALSDEIEQIYEANSQGKLLQVHTTASNGVIKFGETIIPLNDVTYIEGTSMVQNFLMYFSGMGGMIGNKLFMDKILILDARNQKMAIL